VVRKSAHRREQPVLGDLTDYPALARLGRCGLGSIEMKGLQMSEENRDVVQIKGLEHNREISVCARMMADSEPWITLRRDYDASVATLTVPSKEVYLATVEDEIAGFIILNMQGAFIGYIQTVCVAPEWRGKGIGSKLMAFAEERILSETPNVFICVSSFNEKARRLYQRLGYQIVGELKDYIVSGHSEILLRKTISPLYEFAKE
jgi:ribosomal protein S18 acetylase RimI-like enzyme